MKGEERELAACWLLGLLGAGAGAGGGEQIEQQQPSEGEYSSSRVAFRLSP